MTNLHMHAFITEVNFFQIQPDSVWMNFKKKKQHLHQAHLKYIKNKLKDFKYPFNIAYFTNSF